MVSPCTGMGVKQLAWLSALSEYWSFDRPLALRRSGTPLLGFYVLCLIYVPLNPSEFTVLKLLDVITHGSNRTSGELD